MPVYGTQRRMGLCTCTSSMGRVNRFACVCVHLSARGSGEPCVMEENERVA